jgi:hypothetical protein
MSNPAVSAVTAYKTLRLITDCIKTATPALDVEFTAKLMLKNNPALSQLICTAFGDEDMSMTSELILLTQVFGDNRTEAEVDEDMAEFLEFYAE